MSSLLSQAHPALFDKGKGAKKVVLLFKFAIHIHIQNVQTNCKGTHSVRLFNENLTFPWIRHFYNYYVTFHISCNRGRLKTRFNFV